jgi:PAS domain S-box-containing protein
MASDPILAQNGSAVSMKDGNARNPWLVLSVGAIIFIGFTVLGASHFTLFHSVVEMTSICIAWSVFLLLWNARPYLRNDALVVLGIAILFGGCFDLLHTAAFPGLNLFESADPANLAAQFWMAARGVEALGFLALVLWRDQWVRVGWVFLAYLTAFVLVTLSILAWRVFPVCFTLEAGLSTFKILGEVAVVAILVISALLLLRKKEEFDTTIVRFLIATLVLSILSEICFMFYVEVQAVFLLAGHYLKIVARFFLYLALIDLSLARPYSLLFKSLESQRRQLEDSELRWRSLSESSPDHVLDLDTNLVIRFANYPAPGQEMHDLLGASILSFLPEGDSARVERILKQALAAEQQVSYETVFENPKAGPIYYETRVLARRQEGKAIGLTLISRDVTTRRRRDQVLESRLLISDFALSHSTSELLQMVLDRGEELTGSRIGFFHVVDPGADALHMKAWSTRTLDGLCQVTGADSHYAIDQAGIWADAVRLGRPVIHNDMAKVSGKKGLPEGHAEVTREIVVPIQRDGVVVGVLGVGNKPMDYEQVDQDLLVNLADLAWDIIVRKQAEEALVESERRLVRTMANLPGMVYRCACDEHWTMEFVSESCRDLTGYEREDLLDNSEVSYASLIHDEDVEKVSLKVNASLEGQEFFQIAYRIIHRDGTIKWVWEQGRGVFDGDELLALEGFIYDISDRVQAEESRIEMERSLLSAQKLESLGILAGGIAHDFNNLLQAIVGFAELARMDLPEGEEASECIGSILEATHRATDLTRQMLAYSGRGRFSTQLLDISREVKAMAQLMESSIPRTVSLDIQLAEGLPPVEADVAQFQQVVLNLIINGAEAVGVEPGTITVSSGVMHCDEEYLRQSAFSGDGLTEEQEPGEYCYLEVSDTGEGMTLEVVEKIFEPFYTTKFTGRGLGLAAVQGIIRGHGGALIIRSEPGVGSTFRVLFPSCEEGETAVLGSGSESLESILEESRPAMAKGLILIADDENHVRDVARRTLERFGLEVLTASDGREALEVYSARSDEIDGVLLDLTMPRMGGEECLRKILEIRHDAKVILMSGYSEQETQDRFEGKRVVGFLEKPFNSRQLSTVLLAAFPEVSRSDALDTDPAG